MDPDKPPRQWEILLICIVGISLVWLYYLSTDLPLLFAGRSFHDRMVHRLDRIEKLYPRSSRILDLARVQMESTGLEIVRFDEDSPDLSGHIKSYMAKWTSVQGLVSWPENQMVIRLGVGLQQSIALGLEDGEDLDTTLLHEMVHVACGPDSLPLLTLSQAEDQLYLCLDDSLSPTGWRIFEQNLVEELVAYLASTAVVQNRPARVPGPGDIAEPKTSSDRFYGDRLDYLIPECFTRGFGKSVVGWSAHFSEAEAEILIGRVDRLRNSAELQQQVEHGLDRFGLLSRDTRQR